MCINYSHEDAALEFILNHYAFTDLDLRSEEKQHFYISLASHVVDQLKISHKLRADLKMYKAFDPAVTKLSIGGLSFGLLSCMPLLYFISTPALSAHTSWLWPVLIMMIGVLILLPLIILGSKSLFHADNVEEYLTNIHNAELQITSILDSAGSENIVELVKMRLDYKNFELEDTKPISIN